MKLVLAAALTASLASPGPAAGHSATVIVNGQPLTGPQMNQLREIVVTQEVRRPDKCELRFAGPPSSALTKRLQVGWQLEVRVGVESGEGSRSLFKGEIVGIETAHGRGGEKMVVVRGFDSLHRLSRARRTRTWSAVSERDLFVQIGAANGFRVEAEDPGFRSGFVYQNNQTDLEFLGQRAGRIGFLLEADGDVLRVTAPSTAFPTPPAPPQFEPLQLTDRDVPGPLRVEVRGWNPETKEELVGEATADTSQSGPGVTYLDDAADELSEEAPNSGALVFSRVELEAVVRARLRDRVGESRFITGLAPGDPSLQAGQSFDLDDLDDRFNGRYFVQGVTHRLSKGGYTSVLRVVRDAQGR